MSPAKPSKRRARPAAPARWEDTAGVLQRFADMGRSSLERHVKDGTFPQPVRLGGRRLWSVAELEKFEQRLLADRSAP